MRQPSLWARLLGVGGLILEDVGAGIGASAELSAIVVAVRVPRREAGRCGVCRRRCPGHDLGEGRRRWRALDLGTCPSYLEAAAPRVPCSAHGVAVTVVPGACHGDGHTRALDDTGARRGTHTAKSPAVQLLRVAGRTVGAVVTRESTGAHAKHDRYAHLRRNGIEETSCERGHCQLTVVVAHEGGTGRGDAAPVLRRPGSRAVCGDRLGQRRRGRLDRQSSPLTWWKLGTG